MRKKKGALPTIVTAVILLVVFDLLGRVIAPSWQLTDYEGDGASQLESSDTAIAANRGAGQDNTPIGTYDVDVTEIEVTVTEGVTITAIVRTPKAPEKGDTTTPALPSKIPGCMFITGAGLANAADVFGDLAWDMASAGVATIVPSKRMDDYTWNRRDYVQMAHDYEASLDVLENWDGVDKTNVGLYAESEGAWITPVIAAERDEIAFSILTSAPVFTPREQMTYAIDDYFRRLDVPFPTSRITSRLTTLDMGSLGPDYADFDVTPYLEKNDQPTLFNYGTADLSMPTIEAPDAARSIMAKAGNSNTLVRYYKGANHQMRVGDEKARQDLPLHEDFTRDITDFALDAKHSTTAGWKTPLVAGDDTPWQASAVVQDLSENGVGGGLVHSVTRLALLQGGGLLLLLVCACTVPVMQASRRRHIRQELALAQLTANSSPDSAETGNVVVKYDELAKEARKRPGFAPGMAPRLWTCGILVFVTTLIWFGYIAYIAVGVFQLTANTVVMYILQDLSRLLVIACTVALASLLARTVEAEILHRGDPVGVRPVVAGRGHIVWFVAYCVAMALCFFMFMFWNLYLV